MEHQVVHFEIEGRDAARLREFYSALFGWRIDVLPNNPAEYGLVSTGGAGGGGDGAGIAGAISRVPDQPSSSWRGPKRDEGYPGHVTVFVEVDNVEAALRQAESLGGRRMQGPDPLQPGIEIGKFTDPEGHLIGLVTRSDHS